MNDESLFSPKLIPPLEEGFLPAVLANRSFHYKVRQSKAGIPLVIGLERGDGAISRFEASIFPLEHPLAMNNFFFVERLVKFLLWQRGGWKVFVGGPRPIGESIRACYSLRGDRRFDYSFMGEDVYERAFTVVACAPEEVPPTLELSHALGYHLDGCRIGFDLGASDRKVSAVVDGNPVYSEEVVWEPRQQHDPAYHYQEIMTALKTAASKMPRVDAIGGSSAGIFIGNRPMIASLFRGIPKAKYADVKSLFLRIRQEMGVPLEVINDGDVTALAGAMSLEDNGILGVALGSSEAVGYVDHKGRITGWLNELAFAPVDYNPEAPVEEWSGDRGCGASYLSQQCVFRLAPKAGIEIPERISDADKLCFVQEKLEARHAGARKIWLSMGYMLGYSLAHYADFYEIKHILILGRCTSGIGGQIILEGAQEVFHTEFPELATRLQIQLPDEKSRRVGQSIAAASLPDILPQKGN
jgi:predicted NBD/HSP70 family sugar kinase